MKSKKTRFWPDSGTLVPLERYAPVEKVNYCNLKESHIKETFDYDLTSGFDKATEAVGNII